MTDWTNKAVDELRAEILTPENGVTFAEATNELARKAQANDAMRATLSNWCVQFGAALCPTAGSADSFGDGMRAAKKQVSRILAAAPTAASSGAPAPADPWTPVQCDYDRNIHANPDANAWADFFVQVHPGLADKHDLMRAWFANAMMAMHDSPRCKPAPADSQREAAIEAFITACTNIDWGQHLLNQGGCFHVEDGRLCGRARTWAGHQGGNHLHLFVPLYVAVTKIAQLRSAPPAPVAPVTDAEVEAAIRAYRSECIAPPEDDACEDEAFGYLRSLIARRVAEARGAGLREFKAWFAEKATWTIEATAEAPAVRGYSVAPRDIDTQIDRLLAAPPASKLAEEPAQEPKTDLSWRSEFADLKRVTHAEWLRHDKLIVAIHAQVESQARRIEALERAAQGGGK